MSKVGIELGYGDFYPNSILTEEVLYFCQQFQASLAVRRFGDSVEMSWCRSRHKEFC